MVKQEEKKSHLWDWISMPDICLRTSLFLWYDFEYRKVCKINAYVLQTLLSKLFWLAVKEIITNQKPLDMKKLQAFRLLFATTQIITCKVFKLFDHSNITLIMSFKMLPSVSILLQDSFFQLLFYVQYIFWMNWTNSTLQ